MTLPGRTSTGIDYRYGYQGSEKDDELKGEGNSYTTHYRMLDPRVAKWMSIDPKGTAFETPYSSMSNNPIWFNDKLGDTIKVYSKNMDKNGNMRTLNGKPNSKFDGKNLYMLFAADDGLKTISNIDINGFNAKYQFFDTKISMSINGEEVVRKKTVKFLYSNKTKPEVLSQAVNVTSLGEVASFISKGDRYAHKYSDLVAPEMMLNRYWNHGKVMDYKSKIAKGYEYTYIKDIGFFSSDMVGNIAYGWAWGGYDNKLSNFLGMGDFLQNDQRFNLGHTVIEIDTVDDVYDSFYIALGWKMRLQYSDNTNIGLSKMTNLLSSFRKETTHSSFLGDDKSINVYNINNNEKLKVKAD